MKLIEAIGRSPLLELHTTTSNPRVRLLAKFEGANPGGSVKDRPARAMVLGAETRGELDGVTLIEPTSGNTGIALAMIAAARGLPIELVMPETATAERILTMRALGATVTLTSATGSMEGAIDHAREKVAKGGYRMLDQFSNPDNWRAHFETTGPEIYEGTDGNVSHFVSAMGTTGTIMGVSRYLKAQRSDIQVIGCQPTDGSKIAGIRRWPTEYLPKIFEPERVDEVIDVAQQAAEDTTLTLAREAGFFVGVSAGGAVWAARQVCQRLSEGTVVVILPDRGDRYLSSKLFGGDA